MQTKVTDEEILLKCDCGMEEYHEGNLKDAIDLARSKFDHRPHCKGFQLNYSAYIEVN